MYWAIHVTRCNTSNRKYHNCLTLLTWTEKLLIGARYEIAPSGTPARCSTSWLIESVGTVCLFNVIQFKCTSYCTVSMRIYSVYRIYSLLSWKLSLTILSYAIVEKLCAQWKFQTGLGALHNALDALKNIVIFKAKLVLPFSFLNPFSLYR